MVEMSDLFDCEVDEFQKKAKVKLKSKFANNHPILFPNQTAHSRLESTRTLMEWGRIGRAIGLNSFQSFY